MVVALASLRMSHTALVEVAVCPFGLAKNNRAVTNDG